MSFLDTLAEKYPDIPRSVLLKAELLRLGIRLGEAPVGTRHYHHHDEQGQRPVPDPRAHSQGSIRLEDGSFVFVAQSPGSPYVTVPDRETGRLRIHRDGSGVVGEATAGPRFGWTEARTAKNTPMGAIFSPSLGGACGPVAAFLLRHCEFAAHDEECRFCSWVRMGKSREMRPDPDDMRDALRAIWNEQKTIGYFAFSGGSLFNRTKEADAFLGYMEAARATGLALPTTVAAIQALDAPDSQRLKDAGFDYVCYSMEVWDETLWPEILPGKSRSLGRDAWMRCLTDAVKVFGEGRVLCNFVAGVETAVPGRYPSPEAAADHTLEGMRWCYDNGIYPKYATWIVQGGSRFADREPTPLEYSVQLMRGRQALYEEYAMPVPTTDCVHCLTQSYEADLARLDPSRYARGAAGAYPWSSAHPPAEVARA